MCVCVFVCVRERERERERESINQTKLVFNSGPSDRVTDALAVLQDTI